MRWVVLAALLCSCRLALESTATSTGDDTKIDASTTVDGGDCTKLASGQCACKVSTAATCTAAVGHKDFAYINDNILNFNCGGTSCHQANSTSNAKKNPYGSAAVSYASLVNFDSNVTPGVKLVVAGHPEQSYALVMLNMLQTAEFSPPTVAYPPSDVGLMPQANGTLCCQKLDAIQAWIADGAQNN